MQIETNYSKFIYRRFFPTETNILQKVIQLMGHEELANVARSRCKEMDDTEMILFVLRLFGPFDKDFTIAVAASLVNDLKGN
jgi:hypothetical protein